MISNRFLISSAVLCAAVFSLSGCGRNLNTTSYNVSGTIELDGVPIPRGTIQFAPDKSKGNEGPMGFAKIVDGKYNTKGRDSQGIEGGHYVIIITGYDGKETESPAGYSLKNGKKLFEAYSVHHEFPSENATYDLNISSEDVTPPVNE